VKRIGSKKFIIVCSPVNNKEKKATYYYDFESGKNNRQYDKAFWSECQVHHIVFSKKEEFENSSLQKKTIT